MEKNEESSYIRKSPTIALPERTRGKAETMKARSRPQLALAVHCSRDDELVDCESITALPEDRGWEGSERLN
jgi:hypothetical protein